MKNEVLFYHISFGFFLKLKIFRTNIVENIKIHASCSVILFQKSYRLFDKVEKIFTAGEATDDNIVHAHSMLDN